MEPDPDTEKPANDGPEQPSEDAEPERTEGAPPRALRALDHELNQCKTADDCVSLFQKREPLCANKEEEKELDLRISQRRDELAGGTETAAKESAKEGQLFENRKEYE